MCSPSTVSTSAVKAEGITVAVVVTTVSAGTISSLSVAESNTLITVDITGVTGIVSVSSIDGIVTVSSIDGIVAVVALNIAVTLGDLGGSLHNLGLGSKLGCGLGGSHELGGCGRDTLLEFLLALGKADNAACDTFAHALSDAGVTFVGSGVFGHVVVVLSFVDDHGAADNGVGSAEHDKSVSVFVSASSVPSDLELLNITNSALSDVLVGVTVRGTVGVVDIASGLATVLEVTELVDLESVEATLHALDFADNAGKITRLLHKLNTGGGVGVSEEVELTRGADSLIGLVAFVVVIDWEDIVGADITGTDGRADLVVVDTALTGGSGALSNGGSVALNASTIAGSETTKGAGVSAILFGLSLDLGGICDSHGKSQGSSEFHCYVYVFSKLANFDKE